MPTLTKTARLLLNLPRLRGSVLAHDAARYLRIVHTYNDPQAYPGDTWYWTQQHIRNEARRTVRHMLYLAFVHECDRKES